MHCTFWGKFFNQENKAVTRQVFVFRWVVGITCHSKQFLAKTGSFSYFQDFSRELYYLKLSLVSNQNTAVILVDITGFCSKPRRALKAHSGAQLRASNQSTEFAGSLLMHPLRTKLSIDSASL